MTKIEKTRTPVPTSIGVLMLCVVVLSLRWPFRISLETLRGAGHNDATTLAFLSTFLMVGAGIPGVVITAFRPDVMNGPIRILVAASLLSILVGCLGTLVWIGASVRMIGVTLSPFQVLEFATPPVVAAVAAVWLRFRMGREVADIES